MVKFIENATKEFEQNGRSSAFVSMENRIIKKANPMQIYFFARYAKGASIKRLQSAMLKYCTVEQGYYFVKHIKGANLRAFSLLAVETDNKFWTEMFINLANKRNETDLIADLIVGFEPGNKPQALARKSFDITEALTYAREEYKKRGRSENFVAIENYCLHSDVPADSNLFIQNVNGADIRAFERAALLKGDPLQMFILATHIPGSDVKLMYQALQMTKNDYEAVEKSSAELMRRRHYVIAQLKKADTEEEIKKWTEAYRQLPEEPEYISQINAYYLPGVKYKARKQGLNL